MPLIALKLSQTLYNEAVDLVERGEYRDIQQVLEVALRNHLQLERQFQRSNSRTAETAGPRLKSPNAAAWSFAAGGTNLQNSSTVSPSEWDVVMAPFRLFSGARSPAASATESRPVNERMYSLVNRLLPLKLITRWLEARASTIGHWPGTADTQEEMAAPMEEVGSALARLDATAARKRDDQLATSLPRIENPKSRERFLTQFLARFTDAGEISPGGVIQFALVALKNDQFVLTEKGQEFSRLANPLIDTAETDIADTLTAAERTLLIGQIKEYMPSEAAHLNALLRSVLDGAMTPERVIEALMGQFAADSTEAGFRSYVSGVVARAIDLRLLHREWKGRFVHYSVTDSGRSTIDSLKINQLSPAGATKG